MSFDFEKIRGTPLETILELVFTYPVREAYKCEKAISLMRELGMSETSFRHYFHIIKKFAGIAEMSFGKERRKQIRLDFKELIASGMNRSNAEATLMLKYSIAHVTVTKAIAGCLKEGDDA